MKKYQDGTKLFIQLMFIFALSANFLDTARALSDKRLCADENCEEIISIGVGKINYRAGEEGMVSFQGNDNIKIKSKSAGKRPELWGIEVNGREGYAPKDYILEKRILKKQADLKHEVDVEPRKPVQSLATSEKIIDEKTAAETRTTTPLNADSLVSTENPNEKYTATSSPIATPVPSQVVTEVPVYTYDVNEKETSTEDVEGNHYDAANDDEKVENFQGQSQAVDINISNKNKDNLEKVNNETVEEKKEEVKEDDVKQVDISTESSETVTQEYTNAKEPRNSPVNNHFVDVDVGDKNYSTSGEQTQNHVNNTTVVYNSASDKHNSEIAENDISSKEDNISTAVGQKSPMASESSKEEEEEEEKTKPTSSSADPEYGTPSQNYDGEIETTQENEQQKPLENEENKSTQHFNRSDTEEKVEKTKPTSSNADPEYNAPNQNYDGETETTQENDEQKLIENEENKSTQQFKRSDTDINDIIGKNEIPKSFDYNSTGGRTEIVGDKKHLYNSGNLGKSEPETKANINKEINSNYNSTQTVNEDNTSKQPATESNVDSKYESPTEKSPHSETVSRKSGVESNDTAENKIDEHQTTNNVLEESDMTTNTTNHPSVEEINSTSNENFDNNQDVQSEQPYKDLPLKSSVLDTAATGSPKFSITDTESDEKQKSHEDNTKEVIVNTTPQMPEQALSQKETVNENINPTTHKPSDDIPLTTPLPVEVDYFYEEKATTILPNAFNDQKTDNIQNNFDSSERPTTETYNSIPQSTISTTIVSQSVETKNDPKALPSSTPFDTFDVKENKGLFATIMGTVNNIISNPKKNKQQVFDGDNELDSILYPKKINNAKEHEESNGENNLLYCKNIGPGGDCPQTDQIHDSSVSSHFHHEYTNSILETDLSWDTFLKSMGSKILEMSKLLLFLVIVAATILVFLFGYYCFCNTSREGPLLSKLNQLESSLLATHKENSILKHNLMATRHKLASIEDNSFGSNDMVVSLKKELEEELMEKARLQEQITVLQKELENAADAGIELNKIVSELLSNQTGDESIISSVEELQKQLNEQQNTIFEINASLAEKSRENSELQLLIAEQNARYETELATVQRDNDELEHEKGTLLTKLEEMKNDFDKDITAALEGKNMEIKRLQNEIIDLTNKLENEHTKWQTSVAKIEALEECLKNVRKDPNVNISEVIDVAYVKAQLIEIQKKYKSLKERHETELDSRKLAESQLEVVCMEVEKLKQDFNQSEKDKLEAQTRLEVLSNYFKDKENQLQKELNLKEAMWLKQQGETTTTVDRLTAMQEEIQSLKSQNDSLRAEIEAQVAAYKAKTGTLENRAHETWLAARQSDRRYEEARAEATALRRKLTALAGGNVSEINKPSAAATTLGDDLTQAPSPIQMESPGSPMLGRMPPPPFLPPPFMGHPPPFIGMPPPPPFVPPCEMRPAPLGRIMSPPPQRSGRFSPQRLDYDDYLDYDTNNSWHHRHTYSPPPRTYRSLSPTDSRYNYGTERDLISTYDTETDFSPPPSPRESRRRLGTSSERIDTKISYGNTNKFNSSSKGPLSSGSEKSFNTPSHNETKTKKGNSSGAGKSLV